MDSEGKTPGSRAYNWNNFGGDWDAENFWSIPKACVKRYVHWYCWIWFLFCEKKCWQISELSDLNYLSVKDVLWRYWTKGGWWNRSIYTYKYQILLSYIFIKFAFIQSYFDIVRGWVQVREIAIFFRNYVSTRTITLYVPEDVGDWWASRLLIYDQVFLDLLFLLGPHNVLFQPSGNCKVIGTHRHWRHHPLLKVRWLIAMSCWINIALSISLLALSC